MLDEQRVGRLDRLRARLGRAMLPVVSRWAEDPVARLEREVVGSGVAASGSVRLDDLEAAVRDVEEAFARFTAQRPSYMHQLEVTKRQMAMMRSMGVRHPYWDLNGKQAGYRFAAAHGISHPRIHGRFRAFDEIDLDALPDRFLVKPDSGANNRGVLGLDRRGDGTYVDRLLGRTLTWDEIRREYVGHVEAGSISASLIVEELLRKADGSDAIPDDFKVYCFYDRAALIMQRDMAQTQDRSQWRFKLWSRDWNDVGPVKYADRYHPELERPPHAAEIVEAAERLGAALRLPFIRLDFYDTDRGVVFGEFTLTPGPPEVFTADVDEYLGRHREFAAARLLAEDIAAGHLDHLRPPRADQADS